MTGATHSDQPRRFEVSFHDGASETVDAVRVEDNDGWLYFYESDGPWLMRVPAHAVRSVRSGVRPTAAAARAE